MRWQQNHDSHYKEKKEIRGVYIKQGGRRGLIVKNVFYGIFEKSSKIVFHLLKGQNKGFLRLIMFIGYNNI